jgi:hypothetical protein
MKTRQQAADEYINESRKNLNSDSVFTITRSDLYEHWNDAFLAGCEFEAQNRWISVYKEAPDYMQTCIICDHLGIILMAQYSGYGNIFMLYNTTYIANEWMRLHSPPKPQEQ